METPLSAVHAWLRHDDPGDFSWTGDVPQAARMLRAQGPKAVNEEYGTGSPGELQYGIEHHDPIMAARARFPALNMGMTFGEEMFNPSNVIGGKIIQGGGALLGAARRASPMLDE
jgi:hypothetical protein